MVEGGVAIGGGGGGEGGSVVVPGGGAVEEAIVLPDVDVALSSSSLSSPELSAASSFSFLSSSRR